MNKSDEEHSYPDMLTHHQIINRFKKLFGRDMTPKERQCLLLPNEDPPSVEEKKDS
jgi:hypothetical protein